MYDKEIETLSKVMKRSVNLEDSLLDYVINKDKYQYGTKDYQSLFQMIKKYKGAIYQLAQSDKQYIHMPEIRHKLSSLRMFIDVAIPRITKIPGGAYEGSSIDHELMWISDYIADYLDLDHNSEESLSDAIDISSYIKETSPKENRNHKTVDFRRWLDSIFDSNIAEALSGEAEERERKLNAVRDAFIRGMRMKEDREAEEALSKPNSPEESFLEAVVGLLKQYKTSHNLSQYPEAYIEELSQARYPDILDQCVDLILEAEGRV